MKKKVLVLILLLVIGFATVSTTLILKSNVDIGANESDFDVIFTEALLNGNNKDETFLIYDKKEITFQTEKLKNVGDKSRLDYKVKNNSTQYGANVTINCNSYGNEYVSVEGEFDGNKFPLVEPIEMEAQEIKEGYIKAEMIKSYIGEDDAISITCTITANATEKEEIAEYIPTMLYKDETLKGTDPVLNEGLIPVVIADDGIVTYADIEEKWYDYENKEWANAVILEEGTSGYKKGDIIPEEKIESYFVWIPRYKYQIFDEGKYTTQAGNSKPSTSIAKEIQIEFESKDTPISTGSTKGSWLTHPAFINFDVNGLWVGKFETGYKDAKTKEEAQVNAVDTSRVIIKPNVYSWRNSMVANMFKTAYNYNREMDSHLIKNTEWGAVAYLSHSKYGINTEVKTNNNSDYKTGYSSTENADQSDFPGDYGTDLSLTQPYNTPTGYKASTTGNITGIYDMSGGIHDGTAAYMDGYGLVSSGFTANDLVQYEKYLDKYSNTSDMTSWNNRKLGDATGEMGPFYYYADKNLVTKYHNNWYADESVFISSANPWFVRGGMHGNGVLAGPFRFYWSTGAASINIGSRLVLAPKDN